MEQLPADVDCNQAGAWDQAVVRGDGTALAGVSPAGINVAPNAAVTFLQDGSAPGGANITIGTHAITIDGTTGRVSMQ